MAIKEGLGPHLGPNGLVESNTQPLAIRQ